MPDLSRVGVRNELAARREPYWHRLWVGCFLGYRPSKRSSLGTWIVRVFEPTSKKYKLKALGSFDHLPGNRQFGAAKDAAERFAIELKTAHAGRQTPDRLGTLADDRASDLALPETNSRNDRKLLSHIRSYRVLDR